MGNLRRLVNYQNVKRVKTLTLLFLLVFGGMTTSAQNLTGADRKKLEENLKEFREQMKNANTDEKKVLEAYGVPGMIKNLE